MESDTESPKFEERLDDLQGLLVNSLIAKLGQDDVSTSDLNVARLLLKDHDYVAIETEGIKQIGLTFSEEELQDLEENTA